MALCWARLMEWSSRDTQHGGSVLRVLGMDTGWEGLENPQQLKTHIEQAGALAAESARETPPVSRLQPAESPRGACLMCICTMQRSVKESWAKTFNSWASVSSVIKIKTK